MTMKYLIATTAVCMALGGAALAEQATVGMYAFAPDGGARLVMPAGAALAAGDTVAVLVPEIGGDGLRQGVVTVGEPAQPTENDLMTFEGPATWSASSLSDEDYFGIALPGLAEGAAPDVDGNGVPETAVACTSAESVQLALTEGTGPTLRLVWYQPVYLGYDTEPTCSDDFFAAVERGM
jgi:hypothetical protein